MNYLKRSRAVLLSALCCALTPAFSDDSDPAAAYVRAIRLIADGELKAAQDLLTAASRAEPLRDWAAVASGKIAEEDADLKRAERLYSSVPSTSAASLDARVGLYRLAKKEDAAELEQVLRKNSRGDLVLELWWAQAVRLITAGDKKTAITILQKLRKQYPGNPLVPEARELVERERGAKKLTAAEFLEEAQLQSREGRAESALALLRKARSTSPESVLLEETLLRKLRRTKEADQILKRLAASGGPGVGDTVLLRLARSAWNDNVYAEGLKLLDRLEARFRSSPLRWEGEYIRGRIFEERERFADAKKVFRRIAETPAADDGVRLRAQKRLAWLPLLAGDFKEAASAFESMRKQAERAVERVRPDAAESAFLPLSEKASADAAAARSKFFLFLDDYRHAAFWEAYALRQIAKSAPADLPEPQDLLAELAAKDLRGFYGFLARRELKQNVVPKEVLAAFKADRTAAASGACLEPSAAERERLRFFNAPGLGAIAAHEVNWTFASGSLSRTPKAGDGPGSRLTRAVTKALLYSEAGLHRSSLELADDRLSDFSIRGKAAEDLAECREVLFDLAFPVVFPEAFEEAAEAAKIPVTLLYGIARTESHFDPRAVSPVGALGIAQLMPQTAVREGFKPSGDDGYDQLFDPAVNLRLSARHLARLSNEMGGNRPAMIASYNAGTLPVKRWKIRFPNVTPEQWIELITYSETQKYVKRVLLAESFYKARK